LHIAYNLYETKLLKTFSYMVLYSKISNAVIKNFFFHEENDMQVQTNNLI